MSNLISSGSAPQAANHYLAGARQIPDGKGTVFSNTQCYINLHLGPPVSTFETYGGFSGFSSGADNSIKFLEDVPEGAKGVVLLPTFICPTLNTSTAYIKVYACHPDDKLTAPTNDLTLASEIETDIAVANYDINPGNGEIVVPCNDKSQICLAWNHANTGTSRYIRIFYRGFTM